MTDKILLGYEGDLMDKDFWSWFAGFWEGEGSCCPPSRYNSKIKSRRYPRARLNVAQAVREPLDYIQHQTLIGAITFRAPKRRRYVPWNDKGCYVWQVNRTRDIIKIVENMLPFLRFRRKQVKDFLKEVKEKESRAKWLSWTSDEINVLRELYPVATHIELTRKLRRSWSSIKQKAQKLGLRRQRNE